jgi:zinc protease
MRGKLRLFVQITLLLFCLSHIYTQDVIELYLPKSNKIIVKLVFRNGSICDPEGKEGLTFSTVSLMTQGAAGDLSYGEIQDKLYPWAAEYSANVDKEVSVFTFQFPSDFSNEFYPVLKAVILKPAFREDDFERIKNNQQNYVEQIIRASSDEVYSKKALEDFLFRGTNYQHMKEGKSESVRLISLDDIKNHYKNFFTKNNLLIGIAGNYSKDITKQLINDLSKLPDINPPIPPPGKANIPEGIEIEIIAKNDAFGSAIFTGAPLALTREHDDFAALMVANSWMGEHRKSYANLFQKIREVRSMNYGDYSYIEWYDNGEFFQLPPSGVPRHSNYFSIWIRPVQIAKQLKDQYKELADIKIGHAHFALRMAIREFDLLIKNGMTANSFEETRTFLQSYIKLYAQSPAEQLGYLMDSRFYGRDNYLQELDSLLEMLKIDDVNKAIRKYWQTENMYITIITDTSEAELLANSLRKNLESPMSYSNFVKSSLAQDVLKEDDQAANYKLNVKSVKIVKSENTFQ